MFPILLLLLKVLENIPPFIYWMCPQHLTSNSFFKHTLPSASRILRTSSPLPNLCYLICTVAHFLTLPLWGLCYLWFYPGVDSPHSFNNSLPNTLLFTLWSLSLLALVSIIPLVHASISSLTAVFTPCFWH